MAKTKITVLKFESINGVSFPEQIKIQVYFDRVFFCYIPDEILALIKKEDTDIRYEREKDSLSGKKAVTVLKGQSPEDLKNKLYLYYNYFFSGNVIEEKVIAFRFNFNSNDTYFNHSNKISFADTPALSLWWRIYWKVTFPDGSVNIMSNRYEGFGNICTGKFSTPVNDYKEKWIDWTEDREAFFKSMTESMEQMIKKVNDFFIADPDQISFLIDSKTKLLGS